MSAAECGACKRRFSSDSAFDRHQTLGDGTFGSVTCHDPEARGLVLNRRGQWARPGNRPVPAAHDENAGLTGVAGAPAP